MIINDIRAKARWLYGEDSMLLFIRACLSDATLSMLLYRTMSFCNGVLVLKPVAFLCQKLNAIICGCVIGLDTKFGDNFIILHSVGVVVNSAVVGGDCITLESGVVIGAEKGKSPRLGSRIFVGSGAKIIGELTIGDDSVIGANAVVVKSVETKNVVGGVPAKVIRVIDP
jgi:serine O-acetyltransferase